MGPLKLVLFDVDGTLIDSQHAIVSAMEAAADEANLPVPTRADTLSVVGLSLVEAIARLFGTFTAEDQARMVQAYRDTYMRARQQDGTPPFYAGALAVLEELSERDEVFLGTATGMSRRGMQRIIDTYGIGDLFATTQTADDHPSKPNPAMVNAALAETGVEPEHAIFVGDTVFDVEAGRAAGVSTIGVTWGYHAARDLEAAGADVVIDRVPDLVPTIDRLWSGT
jgi:phosphoglycolate phosphatase